jgi:hypothetical protein
MTDPATKTEEQVLPKPFTSNPDAPKVEFQHASDEAATVVGAAYSRRYLPSEYWEEGDPEPKVIDPEVQAKATEIGRWLELRYMTPEQIADEYPDGLPPDPTKGLAVPSDAGKEAVAAKEKAAREAAAKEPAKAA